MKLYSCLALAQFSFCSLFLSAQDYSAFTTTVQSFRTADSATRESMWDRLKVSKKIPFIVHDSVAFFYRGQSQKVEWMGDFNAWGYDKKLNMQGQSIGQGFWMLKASFPIDSRLDYKILLNGTEWRLDTNNPYQQWSGVGGGSPNSELRMPAWQEDAAVQILPRDNGGKVSEDILLYSPSLGYQAMYKTYLPPQYESLQNLPIIYVTDGYEYLHPKMGNMVAVLDYLILEKKIKPIVAVFVDHREPVNRSNNRRMEELNLNPLYLKFFVDELIPQIEKDLKVDKRPVSRGIMGTSVGGLAAAYFSFTRPDVFGLAGIQSPAFYSQPQIYKICDTPENPSIKVYMTTGMVNDVSPGTRKMKGILEKTACSYHYKEVNEGHSWGNWRNLIDDILIDFFALK